MQGRRRGEPAQPGPDHDDVHVHTPDAWSDWSSEISPRTSRPWTPPYWAPGRTCTIVLATVLTAVGVRMATVERQRTLARYELSFAAVRDAALRVELVAGGDTIRRRGAALLARAGVTADH